MTNKWNCSICLDCKHYPMSLNPCGHTVCQTCLIKIEKCPECRKVIERWNPNYELGRILGKEYVAVNETESVNITHPQQEDVIHRIVCKFDAKFLHIVHGHLYANNLLNIIMNKKYINC